MGNKVKLFKNSARKNITKHEPYIPQYKQMGVDPVEYRSSVVPNIPKPSPLSTHQVKKIVTNQPYASIPAKSLGRGTQVLPNVGNNVEQTWSSVDAEIVDDISLENQQLIDNNDFVSEAALNDSGFQESEYSDLLSVLEELEKSSYLLLIKGNPICSGPLEEMEDQIQALMLGEHEICDGEPVAEEDIMVLKKMNLKLVSLE